MLRQPRPGQADPAARRRSTGKLLGGHTYDWPAVDHEQLHRARAERIGALMRAERLDHLLLTSFDNIRYVTGYRTQIISKGFDWFAAVARVRAENLVQVMRPGGIR